MESDNPKLHFSEDAYQDAFETLTDQFADAGYDPDSVVWIARGGARLGVELSHHFDAPYGSVKARHYDAGGVLDEVHVDDTMLGDVYGDVLLVDDIVDSGKTMEAVHDVLDGEDAVERVRTATIHRKPRTVFEPDHHVETVDDGEWVVYPWER